MKKMKRERKKKEKTILYMSMKKRKKAYPECVNSFYNSKNTIQKN